MPNIKVDEYVIALDRSTPFTTVLLTVKDNEGNVHGPFEFVPPFAHQLSDELCVASARATKKVTGSEGAETHGQGPGDGT